MKKINFFILSFCCVGLLFANTGEQNPANQQAIDRYNSLFDEINEIRVGVLDKDINMLTNPFITPVVVSKRTGTPLPPLVLHAIVENQRVLINDKWYELKSSVHGLRLSTIKDNSVILTGTNRSIELYLRKENENSIIK